MKDEATNSITTTHLRLERITAVALCALDWHIGGLPAEIPELTRRPTVPPLAYATGINDEDDPSA